MAKRRGNPNWGKPEPIGPVVPTVTSFEQIVKEFKLPPDQYIRSTRLREWARRNKNSKYIPEALLEAWGFEIESTLRPFLVFFTKALRIPGRFCCFGGG